MATLILAWINAKYEAGYKELFIATIIVDVCIFELIAEVLKGAV